jgi:hypothetical protein
MAAVALGAIRIGEDPGFAVAPTSCARLVDAKKSGHPLAIPSEGLEALARRGQAVPAWLVNVWTSYWSIAVSSRVESALERS